jgi:hypothetical protein
LLTLPQRDARKGFSVESPFLDRNGNHHLIKRTTSGATGEAL